MEEGGINVTQPSLPLKEETASNKRINHCPECTLSFPACRSVRVQATGETHEQTEDPVF